MAPASPSSAPRGSQKTPAFRKERRGQRSAKIADLRRLLRGSASRGLKGELAEKEMECRVDRLSREDSPAGTAALSIEYVDAAIAFHTAEGRSSLARDLMRLVQRNWPEAPIQAGDLIRVFGRDGQLFLRFE